MGQKYGPFNDIPAVWDQFFGTKGYKALAAGIAGALTSLTSSVWSQAFLLHHQPHRNFHSDINLTKATVLTKASVASGLCLHGIGCCG